MVLFRSILATLAASLLFTDVRSFTPSKSKTVNQVPITANQAFNLPNFFGGGGLGINSADKSTKTNIIAGATGYIGKSTVRESVRQGYNTIALVRDLSKVESAQGKALYGQFFEGAKLVECDVCDMEALTKVRSDRDSHYDQI